MKTIKLTLSEWLVKELRYYEAHHQIDINDFISNSVSEYLKNTDISAENIITSDNTKTVMTIEMSKDIAEQLQITANEIIPSDYGGVVTNYSPENKSGISRIFYSSSKSNNW